MPSLGRQLARAYNDTVAEDIHGDDRFIGCAWIYLPDIEESVKELRRAVKELGLKAVKFNGGWGDGDLDSEVLYPLYEEIADLNIPILLHPAARVYEAQHSHPVACRQRALSRLSTFPNGARLSADLHGQRVALDLRRRARSFSNVEIRFLRRRHRLGALAHAHARRAYAE